jgi:hypothetical protein
MKPLKESEISFDILVAVECLENAKTALGSTLERIQSSCEHRIVSEMPYRSGNYFGSRSAHRICNHCRLIEEGSHWSGGATWSKHDHSASDLGNVDGRIVIPIDSERFWQMRVST